MATPQNSQMPSPPFPDPNHPMLKLILKRATEIYLHGEGATPPGNIAATLLHAVVHAWYEGHIEGEDHCPGCIFRGDPGIREAFLGEWLRQHGYHG